MQLPTDGESGKVDFIEFDTPTELVVTLLRGLGGSATVDKICKVNAIVCARVCVCMCVCSHVCVYICVCL